MRASSPGCPRSQRSSKSRYGCAEAGCFARRRHCGYSRPRRARVPRARYTEHVADAERYRRSTGGLAIRASGEAARSAGMLGSAMNHGSSTGGLSAPRGAWQRHPIGLDRTTGYCWICHSSSGRHLGTRLSARVVTPEEALWARRPPRHRATDDRDGQRGCPEVSVCGYQTLMTICWSSGRCVTGHRGSVTAAPRGLPAGHSNHACCPRANLGARALSGVARLRLFSAPSSHPALEKVVAESIASARNRR